MEDRQVDDLGWHVISGVHLLEVMRRCQTEDPDLVYAEMWANSDHEYFNEREED